MQRIIKYAKTLEIKGIAVFDWSCLLVVDVHGLSEDARRLHLARGIWYNREGEAHTSGDTFHTTLLGFLLRVISQYPQICWACAAEDSGAINSRPRLIINDVDLEVTQANL